MRMFCIVCEGRAELKLRKWLEICLARTLCREVGLSAPPLPVRQAPCRFRGFRHWHVLSVYTCMNVGAERMRHTTAVGLPKIQLRLSNSHIFVALVERQSAALYQGTTILYLSTWFLVTWELTLGSCH